MAGAQHFLVGGWRAHLEECRAKGLASAIAGHVSKVGSHQATSVGCFCRRTSYLGHSSAPIWLNGGLSHCPQSREAMTAHIYETNQ